VTRYLSADEVRRLYDRIGRFQDTQAFYERRAVAALVGDARFGDARHVVEFGCGTGSFAARVLARCLPQEARYLGLDVSPVMVRLARERLRPWLDRAEVRLTDGSMRLPQGDGEADRVVAAYVLDLLDPDDARALLREASRVLAPGGLVCLASLSVDAAGLAALTARAWEWVWARSPGLVGGCRPIEAARYLAGGDWAGVRTRVVASFGVASEVVVARRR
jgi:ubiquinone/menaquinone biosynthesis C-methylase UbiE